MVEVGDWDELAAKLYRCATRLTGLEEGPTRIRIQAIVKDDGHFTRVSIETLEGPTNPEVLDCIRDVLDTHRYPPSAEERSIDHVLNVQMPGEASEAGPRDILIIRGSEGMRRR